MGQTTRILGKIPFFKRFSEKFKGKIQISIVWYLAIKSFEVIQRESWQLRDTTYFHPPHAGIYLFKVNNENKVWISYFDFHRILDLVYSKVNEFQRRLGIY